MSKYIQLIFVVEADGRSRSDWNYIRKILESAIFTFNPFSVRETPVFLDGKYNYAHNDVQKEISDNIKRFSGMTHVIYVFDTDEASVKNKKKNKGITDYCGALSYPNSIVWFRETIEKVLLGHRVSDYEKPSTSLDFHNRGKLDVSPEAIYRLSRPTYSKTQESNVLCVLKDLLPIRSDFSKLIK